MAATLLVIDDDPASRRLIAAIFAGQDVLVRSAEDAATGLADIERTPPDIIILDLHLPDANGVDLLERLRELAPAAPVVMLTAHADVKTAVRATQLGAFDYLTKPAEPEEVVLTVRRALETRALRQEVAALRQQVGEGESLTRRMGESRAVAAVAEQVQTVAATNLSVLVLGETGTGKELVAQAIHRQSERARAAFVAVDCGAIPEALLESELFGHERGAFTGAERRQLGRFRIAEGGTLLLDEVGNLPLGLQAKLLRVLESRQLQSLGAASSTSLDVRFVAATNDDLEAQVAAAKFRSDLYFRLAEYTIVVPPLRERVEDIAYLARRFLAEASVELRRPVRDLAPEAVAALERHAWPGNVRELRNVVRQAVLEARDVVLRRADVQKLLRQQRKLEAGSDAVAPGTSLREAAVAAAQAAERQLICATLRQTQGNKSRAARALATDYKTLHLKMKALGVRARDFMP